MMQLELAYIDPGTGSLLLSFIVGSAIGAGLFLRRMFYRLATWIAGQRSEASPTHEAR